MIALNLTPEQFSMLYYVTCRAHTVAGLIADSGWKEEDSVAMLREVGKQILPAVPEPENEA